METRGGVSWIICILLALMHFNLCVSGIPFTGLSTNIQCYACTNAQSNDDCNRNIVTCQASQGSCQTEIRVFNKSNNLEVLITKGCKQTQACINNELQNDKLAWPVTQCNFIPSTPLSVCRFCCNESRCNQKIEVSERTCSPLKAPQNGVVFCNYLGSQYRTEVCYFKCNQCYSLIGSKQRMCLSNTTWSGKTTQCVHDKDCEFCDWDMTFYPNNGGVICTNENKVGSICSFSCEDGFELSGENNILCKNEDHQWTDIKPKCIVKRAIQCNPLSLELGAVECSSMSLSPGTVCNLTCGPCHINIGSQSTVCQVDGTWSGYELKCVLAEACNHIKPCPDTMTTDLPNGAVRCSDANKDGSVCTFLCQDGFRLNGISEAICLNATWDATKPTCEQDTQPLQLCNSISVEFGVVECNSTLLSPGTTCKLTCKSCYVYFGQKSTTCQTDGSWSENILECVLDYPCQIATKCAIEMKSTSLNEIAVNCTDDNNHGSVCSFSCQAGFVLNGKSETTCLDGTWDEPRPTCVKECHPLAIASTDDSGKCTCRRGFQGDGFLCIDVDECKNQGLNLCHQQHAICTNTVGSYKCRCLDGFRGDGFSCVDINECLQPDEIAYRCNRENGICFNEVGGYNCTCKDGFKGDGIVCTANNPICPPNNLFDDDYCLRYILVESLDPTLTASDACANVESGHPAQIRTERQYNILNAILELVLVPNNFPNIKILGPWIGLHDKYEPGVYRWRDGSLLSDSDHTAWSVGHPKVSKGEPRCVHLVYNPNKNNGSRKFFWEDSKCINQARYICNTEKTYENINVCKPALSQIPRGRIFCTNGWNIDSFCTYTCDPGYQLVGPTDSVRCRAPFMRWDNVIPHCVEATCAPQITSPNGGNVSCENGNRIGSKCTFMCHEGYQMSGDANMECRADLTWSGKRPCCTDECPPKARIDLIFMLDSSGSVGVNNFYKTKEFVTTMYSKFEVSTVYTEVSIVKFHSTVELVNDTLWFNDKKDLDNVFDELQFTGKGTMTGRALEFVADHVVRQRAGAKTFAVVISDGNTKDSMTLGVSNLREKGVHIFAVGITGSHYLDLSIIASKPSTQNVYSLVDEEGLSSIVDKIGKRVCSIQC
ncbi:unnamed protein product [Clavelina lepadiformis]|uniref:Uncharacterized protein n=1 Tax=Clavelina lepadiformis TaxID=159417 RepID=A0ABP0GFX1_CLALP